MVDDEDLDRVLSAAKWYAVSDKDKFYVMGWGKGGHVSLHRLLCGLKKGDKRLVDHKDGDGLNNQKANLRICSLRENCRNSKLSTRNTSGYKGVNWNNQKVMWRAELRFNYKVICLGHYHAKEEAHIAYCFGALLYFGDYARDL